MTAKNVSVGLTYEVLVSDKLVPVTLTKDCPYGGWYGKNNVTGHTVRIKTAGRLRKQLTGEIAASTEAAKQDATTTQVHTTTMEATVPTTTTRSAAKNDRAARRAKSAPSITLTPTEEVTVSSTTRKPAATPRNANGTIKAKPKAKPAAKPAANGTVKLTGKAKPAAKRAAKTAPKLDPVAPTVNIDAIVAAAVEAAVAEALAKAAPAATVKRTAKAKPVGKPVAITLKPGDAKVNSYSFKYAGKDDKPLVTAVYIMIPLLERFANDGTPVAIEFRPYVQSGKGKPMPKSKIRYSGSDDTIRDLYVDRAGITKLGYTESKPPVVTVEVGKGNVVILTFQPAA